MLVRKKCVRWKTILVFMAVVWAVIPIIVKRWMSRNIVGHQIIQVTQTKFYGLSLSILHYPLSCRQWYVSPKSYLHDSSFLLIHFYETELSYFSAWWTVHHQTILFAPHCRYWVIIWSKLCRAKNILQLFGMKKTAISLRNGGFYGRSVIIGLGKIQPYQWF